jgi:heat-inducible transcriptional repressor
MIDKKEFLLQSIIKAYIEHLEPIGSTQLKSMYDLEYSAATIRGYFKKLGSQLRKRRRTAVRNCILK